MKVFVYTKEQKPKKIAVIKDVAIVTEFKTAGQIMIETIGGIKMVYDMHNVKTVVYQN